MRRSLIVVRTLLSSSLSPRILRPDSLYLLMLSHRSGSERKKLAHFRQVLPGKPDDEDADAHREQSVERGDRRVMRSTERLHEARRAACSGHATDW